MARDSVLFTLSLLLFDVTMIEAKKVHFQHFYPQIRPYMEQYLAEDCSAELATYFTNATSNNGLSCKNCTATIVSGCLLNTFKEVDKANMASAAVLLGILPTMLSLAGSTTAETGLLSLRRPLLAFMIGAGAPAVNPTRTFNYGDPHELMAIRKKSLKMRRPEGAWALAIMLFEYALAGAAVTNLGIVSWQLCIRTITGFAEDTAYLPALWAFLAACVHIFGAIAVAMRIRIYEISSEGLYRQRKFMRVIRDEFKLSSNQPKATLDLTDETLWFLGVSWFTAFGTVVHIIFGTLVFSSILFITTLDAVRVVFQLLGSTCVCRAILMYELSGMRQAVTISASEELDGRSGSRDDIPLIQPSSKTSSWTIHG
jgi:hypothetical protein